MVLREYLFTLQIIVTHRPFVILLTVITGAKTSGLSHGIQPSLHVPQTKFIQ